MSATSTAALVARLHRPLRRASWALTALVAVLAAVLLAAPTAFTTLTTSEARLALQDGPPSGRYLIGTLGRGIAPAPESDPAYPAYAERLAAVRQGFPAQVRASTGPAHWAITLTGILLSPADPGSHPRDARTLLSVKVDPQARGEVRLVAGTWPADTPGGPVPIALSVRSAAGLGWRVGQVRAGHVLTGTWQPRDAGADYWSLNPSMVRPNVIDDGNSRVVVVGTGFTSTQRWRESAELASEGEVEVWYPLDPATVRAGTLDTLVPQLRQLTARSPSAPADDAFSLAAGGLPDLEAAQGRARAARSVLTLAAVGPVGAAVMVLVLAVGGFAARRRSAVGLLANRGASRAWLRGLLALEGLLVGLPAGLLAVVAAWLLVGPPTPAALVLAGLVVLLPAGLLAATPIRSAMRPERADVGARSPRNRPLVEVAVLLLAAASAYLLVSAGLGARGGDVDALVVATPLLLSAAACVVVLRAYPPPLRLLSRRLARGRSTMGWLGSLRALRDPAVRVAPVLTVLVAVAVSLFSVVTLATIQRGTAQTALTRTGAELRLDGPVVSDATYAAVRRLPGVRSAARVQDAGRTNVYVEGAAPRTVQLWRADLAALARVQRGVRGGVSVADTRGQAVLAAALDPVGRVRIGTPDDLVPLRVGGTQAGVAGIDDGDAWVLADASTRGDRAFAPRTLLVALDDGADAAAVGRRIDRLTGSSGTVALADRAVRDLQGQPVTRGLRTFLLAAVVLVVLAALAAVTLSLAMGAAARVRHLAVLRILGVPASRRRWYAVWELVPALSVALVVGALLGLGLALTVHAVVDLAPFTGDAGQPPLVLPWGWLVLLLAGFVVVVALAVGAGVQVAGRRSPAESLRMDEE